MSEKIESGTCRVLVLVSGGGTNLQAILDAKERGELPGVELAGVISNNPGVYALERAKNGSRTQSWTLSLIHI